MNSWRLPLASPDIDDNDRRAVLRVLEGATLSLGPELGAFEEQFSERLAGQPTAAVSSGTAGLYLALRALGVDGGDVITPSYGFVGTLHAIRLCGATPRFADIDPETLCVSRETIEAAWTPDTRAVVPVHLFGTPPPMEEIMALAQSRGVPVVEDSCEAVGAICQGQPAGTHGDAAVFAFYPNKQMTTGEGGLVTARDERVIAQIRSMRNQGRGEGEFEFVNDGFNFRMTEIQAALGRSQLSRLDTLLSQRRRVAEAYLEALDSVPGICGLPPVRSGDERSWFVFPVFVEDPAWRAPLRDALTAVRLQTAPYFPAMHRLEPFLDLEAELPVTEAAAARSFAVPFFGALTATAVEEVVGAMKAALEPLRGQSEADSAFLPTLLAAPA